MVERKLSKEQYAKLKMMCYQIFLLDRAHSDHKATDILLTLIQQYHEQEQQIVSNTLAFPYDVELYNFFIENDFQINDLKNVEFLKKVSNKFRAFSIPIHVLQQKLDEYREYSFINCVGEGLIDWNITVELSKIFALEQQEKENLSENHDKTPKVS